MRGWKGFVGLVVAVAWAGISQAQCNWSGKWSTDYSEMEIYQVDDVITGVYPGWDAGRIEGVVLEGGTKVEGAWFEAPSYSGPTDAGTLEFEIAPDCQSFTGRWDYANSTSWVGGWSGQRIGEITTEDRDAIAHIDGNALEVDGVPTGDGTVVPLTAAEQRRMEWRNQQARLEFERRRVQVQRACEVTENPTMYIIEAIDLSGQTNLDPDAVGALVLRILLEANEICAQGNVSAKGSSAANRVAEVSIENGAYRLLDVDAGLSMLAQTARAHVEITAGQGIQVIHNEAENVTTIDAIQGQAIVTPIEPAGTAVTVPPDYQIVVDSTGASDPILKPIFSSSFD